MATVRAAQACALSESGNVLGNAALRKKIPKCYRSSQLAPYRGITAVSYYPG